MATDLAPVTPEVMAWARETIGVSVAEAAHRAGVSVERIEAWESGDQEPTLAKLRALAKLYQRPISVFFLPEAPRDFDVMRDFRRHVGAAEDNWSRSLHKVFRRAVEQQEVYTELLEDEGETPAATLPSAERADNSEVSGGRIRAYLRVDLTTQFNWRRPEDALSGWIRAVEANGILVLRTSEVQPGEMRGFSLSGAVPVVVLNALDWPRGQVFTLLHELAHLTLREGGLCTLLEPSSGSAAAVETWCNATAAAALMPSEVFLDNPVLADAGTQEWDDEVIGQLSARWGVSREAVVRRLVTLNRASWEFYEAKRAEYLAAYSEAKEQERAKRRSEKNSGGPPPYRMAVRDRGRPFVRLVLDAYHREAVTPSTASRLLNLKLKHMGALEREVGTRP